MLVVIPGDTDARVVIEASARVFFGVAGAVEEHECFADLRDGAEIEDKASSDAAFGPGPILLVEGSDALVLPGAEIGGAFDADTVSG